MTGAVVFFDCDSTLTTLEGVDALATRRGRGEECAALTRQAMAGTLALAESYCARLAIAQPDRAAMAWLARAYQEAAVPDAQQVIASLAATGHEVHMITGGFSQAVKPFADWLGIDQSRVSALEVFLDQDGNYVGYDVHSPLLRASGKAEICLRLMAGRQAQAGIMVGDGATDASVVRHGIYFIQFVGVVDRDLSDSVPMMHHDQAADLRKVETIVGTLLDSRAERQ